MMRNYFTSRSVEVIIFRDFLFRESLVLGIFKYIENFCLIFFYLFIDKNKLYINDLRFQSLHQPRQEYGIQPDKMQ